MLLQTACGPFKYKPVDAREVPPDPKDRVKKNIEEGRGFRIMGGSFGKTTYDFASSNPLWRASLDILDFMPLTNANYSGGIIISDWYSNKNDSSEALKISIRFLSNEIRSDSIKIIVHKKNCSINQSCAVSLLENSTIKSELRSTILTKAILLEKQSKKSK